MKARAQLLIGVLIGALLLVLVGRGIEWSTVIAVLQQASIPHLLFGLAAMLAFMVVKSLRWRYLICPFATATTWQLLPAVFAGTAGNSLVPHAGELVRALVARRHTAAATSTLMGTVVVERILDFVALLVIALAVLIPLGAMTDRLQAAAWALAAIGGGVLALSIVLVVGGEPALAKFERSLARLHPAARERVLRAVRLGVQGLGSLRQPRLLSLVLLLSIVQWLLIAATIYFSLRTAGILEGVVAVASVLLLSVAGVTLPTAPGYIGTLQAAFVLGLAPFGTIAADAVAASVVYNFLVTIPIWIIAAPYLQGHLRDMIRSEDQRVP